MRLYTHAVAAVAVAARTCISTYKWQKEENSRGELLNKTLYKHNITQDGKNTFFLQRLCFGLEHYS